MQEQVREARAVTGEPESHWFGYCDKCPWDATGRYLACLDSNQSGRRQLYVMDVADLVADTPPPAEGLP